MSMPGFCRTTNLNSLALAGTDVILHSEHARFVSMPFFVRLRAGSPVLEPQSYCMTGKEASNKGACRRGMINIKT